jgi:prepilin-type N-terminal cleavage/methylation domain-containing protein
MKTSTSKNIICGLEGFTLVEMLLALAIGTIIISAGFVAVMAGHRASTGIEQKISAQQDIRAALDIMETEIGMASYNPGQVVTGLWLSPTDCATAGAASNKGIQQATTNGYTISVEMDINGNGSVGDNNDIITYSYDAANQRITRQTNCGVAQSFLGDVSTATTTQRNVLVVNNTLGIPVFRYYDGSNNLLAMPAGIPNIRRIDITLAVQATVPDVQGQYRSMVYSTSVVPRNHIVSP